MSSDTGVRLGTHWTCNIRINHARPGLVVQTAAHRSDLSDLTNSELASMGAALEAATQGIKESGPVGQVYVHLLNEGTPRHVHFHVVPRFIDEELIGPELPDTAENSGNFSSTSALLTAEKMFAVERREPSSYVRAILLLANKWHKHLSLYRFMPKLKTVDKAELYVTTWLLIWGLATFLGMLTSGWNLFIALVAMWGYRLIDLVLYELGILLDARPTELISVPRGLVLRIFNLAEVFLSSSALLLLCPGKPEGLSAIRQSFALSTLQPEFGQPGTVTDVILAINWCAVLLIISGGIAMLIGKISETFVDSADTQNARFK